MEIIQKNRWLNVQAGHTVHFKHRSHFLTSSVQSPTTLTWNTMENNCSITLRVVNTIAALPFHLHIRTNNKVSRDSFTSAVFILTHVNSLRLMCEWTLSPPQWSPPLLYDTYALFNTSIPTTFLKEHFTFSWLRPCRPITVLLETELMLQVTMNENSLPLLEDGPVCALKPRGSQAAAPDRQSLAASIATLILTLPALRELCIPYVAETKRSYGQSPSS
jgi:hypothetical protein